MQDSKRAFFDSADWALLKVAQFVQYI